MSSQVPRSINREAATKISFHIRKKLQRKFQVHPKNLTKKFMSSHRQPPISFQLSHASIAWMLSGAFQWKPYGRSTPDMSEPKEMQQRPRIRLEMKYEITNMQNLCSRSGDIGMGVSRKYSSRAAREDSARRNW